MDRLKLGCSQAERQQTVNLPIDGSNPSAPLCGIGETANATVLETVGETLEGSSPSSRTKMTDEAILRWANFIVDQYKNPQGITFKIEPRFFYAEIQKIYDLDDEDMEKIKQLVQTMMWLKDVDHK